MHKLRFPADLQEIIPDLTKHVETRRGAGRPTKKERD